MGKPKIGTTIIRNSDDFARIAAPIFDKYYLPLPVGMGQYAAEGRNKGLGASRNNFYNIAAYDGKEKGMPSYKTPQEGIEAYAKLITREKRYANAMKHKGNPSRMIDEIHRAGYASRPDYASFVRSTPEYLKYAEE
jgi:hypothetical protein